LWTHYGLTTAAESFTATTSPLITHPPTHHHRPSKREVPRAACRLSVYSLYIDCVLCAVRMPVMPHAPAAPHALRAIRDCAACSSCTTPTATTAYTDRSSLILHPPHPHHPVNPKTRAQHLRTAAGTHKQRTNTTTPLGGQPLRRRPSTAGTELGARGSVPAPAPPHESLPCTPLKPGPSSSPAPAPWSARPMPSRSSKASTSRR